MVERRNTLASQGRNEQEGFQGTSADTRRSQKFAVSLAAPFVENKNQVDR